MLIFLKFALKKMQIVLHCYDECLFLKKLKYSLPSPTSFATYLHSCSTKIRITLLQKKKNHFVLENPHFICERNFNRAKFFVAKCLICHKSQLKKRVLSTWNVLNSFGLNMESGFSSSLFCKPHHIKSLFWQIILHSTVYQIW